MKTNIANEIESNGNTQIATPRSEHLNSDPTDLGKKEMDADEEIGNEDPIGYGSTTRKGKVARLPISVRETVNRMIENGSRFQDIIARLDDLGYPGFQHPNISRWKSGGYLDWLALRERLACAKVRADSARELIRDLKNSDDLCHANEILMAAEVHETLLAPPPMPGTPEADKRAKTLHTLSRALATQMSERTRRDRIAFEKQRHSDKMQLTEKETILKERQKRDLNDPLTHEETVSIVHKVDQLFGIKIQPATEAEPGPAPEPPDADTLSPSSPRERAGERGKEPSNLKSSHDCAKPVQSIQLSTSNTQLSDRAPFSTIFHHGSPPQAAPQTENDKSQVTNYQLQIPSRTAEEPSKPNEGAAPETQNPKPETRSKAASQSLLSPLYKRSLLVNSTHNRREPSPCSTSVAPWSIGSRSLLLARKSSTSSASKIVAANTSVGSIRTILIATRPIPNRTHVAPQY